MADDKRISELPLATFPLAGTEEAEVVQGGVNKRAPVNQIGSVVPDADATTKGIAKLYTDLAAQNTDGAPDQNAVFDALALKAPIASPTFTGVPAAPTAAASTNTTQVATTAFVQQEGALKQAIANTATALTDGASIDITGAKHTLTTDEATITFSQSFTGDYTNIDVTFNTTAATWTFPSGSLCVVEGSASGDNTATIAAVSGDKIVISVWFVSSGQYRIAVKNFGQ